VLNIDAGLQSALDGILKSDILHDRTVPDPRSGVLPKAINGAAVVLDVNNGAVLAMSSYPSYNLSSFVNGLSTPSSSICSRSARSTTTRSRSLHPGQHVQVGHGDR